MKNYHKLLIIFITIAVFAACEDYLDINDDPNAIVEVTPESLLPVVQERSAEFQYFLSLFTNRVSQQIGSYFDFINPEETRAASAWETAYLGSMNNLAELIRIADEEDAIHYRGVAKVLMAWNLMNLTDAWEAVPYNEAFRGSNEITPVYDSQEQLYEEINRLLGDGLADLQASESTFSPGNEDLIYGGNLNKWIKAAHTLRARQAVHLLNKDGDYAMEVVQHAMHAFEDNSDDMQLYYNSDANKNPYHTNIALSNNTGNFTFTFGSYFINAMNGDLLGAVDPRLPIITTPDPVNGIYRGIQAWDPDTDPTVDFQEESWYSRAEAPIVMLSYAELQFMVAEAQYELDNTAAAFDAYIEGIRAHMLKLGVAESDIITYLESDAVAGPFELTLSDIMLQKYIATFLTQEGWTDMRRHRFSSSVYPDLPVPTTLEVDQHIERILHVLDEYTRNAENVLDVAKPYYEIMWRDQ